MKKLTTAIIILSLLIALPLLLCAVFKFLPLGSVGPLIPLTGLINAIIIQLLLSRTFSSSIKKGVLRITFIILSMFFSVFLAIIGMNIFVWLTHIFDIMDFQVM